MALTNDDLQAIGNLLQPIKEDLKAIDYLLQPIKEDLKELKRRNLSIELTLENETNPNIKTIAEGHLDLSRKLDESLKVENEKEMLLIRINILENELRKLKERVDQIA